MKDTLEEESKSLSAEGNSPKRAQFGYDCVLKTREYHVVQGEGLERGKLHILPNSSGYRDNHFKKRHTSLFDQ